MPTHTRWPTTGSPRRRKRPLCVAPPKAARGERDLMLPVTRHAARGTCATSNGKRDVSVAMLGALLAHRGGRAIQALVTRRSTSSPVCVRKTYVSTALLTRVVGHDSCLGRAPMKLARVLAVALMSPMFLAHVACTGAVEPTAQDVAEATSCTGAKRDATGKCRLPSGRFAKASCCATADAACHPEIAAAIDACVQARREEPDFEPESTSDWDLYDMCSDPEITAPTRDRICSTGAPPSMCSLATEAFAGQYLPTCRAEALGRFLDGACVFGRRYRDLFGRAENMVVIGRRTLTVSSTLSPLEGAQILAAITATSHPASTVPAAFAAVDRNTIFETELWDASGRRAFTAYEMGAGDNSFGRIFVQGTTNVAATINDGDIEGCTAKWGNERRRCQRNEDCRSGTLCQGQSEASPLGRCIATTRDTHPNQGEECTVTEASFGCPGGSGLVCAGSGIGGTGLCGPGWMRGRFEDRPNMPIPDNKAAGASTELLAYGLATVSTDVRLSLHIGHPRLRDLRVTLQNPAGTEVVVYEGKPGDNRTELYLEDQVVAGFPGDESVNGVWRLKAVDRKSSKVGTVYSFGLELTSRWD